MGGLNLITTSEEVTSGRSLDGAEYETDDVTRIQSQETTGDVTLMTYHHSPCDRRDKPSDIIDGLQGIEFLED